MSGAAQEEEEEEYQQTVLLLKQGILRVTNVQARCGLSSRAFNREPTANL